MWSLLGRAVPSPRAGLRHRALGFARSRASRRFHNVGPVTLAFPWRPVPHVTLTEKGELTETWTETW
jgi:hypothetical protein